ncbi:MAG TPA: addiction module protein [Tepidisphaeraceae bacterium]|jgi:putative addiction module component (TIGR02574 family)|nr:addiction module protein [Tepidisphaeraceae bacterium]
MSTASDLFSKVMELPQLERAELAHRLLLSLEDEPIDPDAEAAWGLELETRAASLDKGEARSSPWRETISRMRRNLEGKGKT